MLSLFIAGKMRIFVDRGNVFKLVLVLMPLLVAMLVAISRVDNYWHHWQDVTVGGLLGLFVSYIVYRQFYPSLWAQDCATPITDKLEPHSLLPITNNDHGSPHGSAASLRTFPPTSGRPLDATMDIPNGAFST